MPVLTFVFGVVIAALGVYCLGSLCWQVACHGRAVLNSGEPLTRVETLGAGAISAAILVVGFVLMVL